jgi:hypothetical protein
MTTTTRRAPARARLVRVALAADHWSLWAGALAGGLALVAIYLRWRGSDLPAHLFRVTLVDRRGFQVWNNYWYGGHHTPGYSLLFPLLGAFVGIWTVAVVSAVASAMMVDQLLRRASNGPWRLVASSWFAAATVTNVAIGRLPFALGMTLGLGALLCARHRVGAAAVVLSIATSAASPVAGAFLSLVWVAQALTRSRGLRARWFMLATAGLGPVVAIALLYPQGGSFPFRWTALLWTLFVSAAVIVLVPAEQAIVRMTARLYALAVIVVFVLPTPLGANVTRFAMYAAGPTLVALSPRRRAVAVLAPLLLFWQWSPAFDAIFRAGKDESTEQSYYRPLVQFLQSADAEAARVEVVPTRRHWEAAYVASEFPIARGWERQLDVRFNPVFYEPELDAEAYRGWLLDSGVAFVALPDAPIDASGEEEAALIEGGLDYLTLVWTSGHWRVWRVDGSKGLLDGAAKLVEVDVDSVTIDVLDPGDVLVRVRSSAFWASDPPLCIEPTEDGWIVVRDARPGRLVVFLDEVDLVQEDAECETAGG